MGAYIDLPNISGNEAERLRSIESYLISLSNKLNWAFNAIDDDSGVFTEYASNNLQSGQNQTVNEKEQKKVEQLKALIIKSADVVEAFSQAIQKQLRGKYVAKSEFGTYVQETTAKYTLSNERFEQRFYSLERVIDTTGEEDAVKINAIIKTGRLDENGTYGVEVGKTVYDAEGNTEFRKFARFLSDKIVFYSEGGYELGSFDTFGLNTNRGVFTESVQIRNFLWDTEGGLSLIYVGER